MAGGAQVLAETFDLDGRQLWFSAYAGQARLMRMGLTLGAKAEALPIPPLPDDAVAHIGQNPVRHDELTIASFKRNVYLSKDAGKTWVQIARDGVAGE
jgi:hypothetical protein